MLITSRTLTIFLTLRDNLTCDPGHFSPESWRIFLPTSGCDELLLDQRRFLLLQRQFSLLRTQMKNDCAIYYGRDVSGDSLFRPFDVDFFCDTRLENVGIWKRAIKDADDKDADGYLEALKERYQGTPDSAVKFG